MLGARQWTLTTRRRNLNTDAIAQRFQVVGYRSAKIERHSLGVVDHNAHRAVTRSLNGQHFKRRLRLGKLTLYLGFYFGRIHWIRG